MKLVKHGYKRKNGISHPEYSAWQHMIQRCVNNNDKKFDDYGGRDIKVCKRWLHNFSNFLKDMGIKPQPKFFYSLDRINNDGNYTPKNCRWATRVQQLKNRRKRKTVQQLKKFIVNKLLLRCNNKYVKHQILKLSCKLGWKL